jgi:hypothetical protein
MQQDEMLIGRKSIADFLGHEDFRTVERSLIPRGAPIAKIGGVWRASKRQLLRWLESEIERECKKMQ